MDRVETGGRIAGPAFAMYYENILKIYPQIQRKFERPEGIIEVNINGEKEYSAMFQNRLVLILKPKQRRCYFFKSNIPDEA
jgi:membrane carboxypeptidase/penicillin-binding protein